MYAIQESAKKINGVELQTFCREVQNARTEIEVEAGTTGFKGGCCRDKGARAFLAIDCNRATSSSIPRRTRMAGLSASRSRAAAMMRWRP